MGAITLLSLFMDYNQYFPPITLRQVFVKDRSPSPELASSLLLRREFSMDPSPDVKSQESKGDNPGDIILLPIESATSRRLSTTIYAG